jgi:hypothetical protein
MSFWICDTSGKVILIETPELGKSAASTCGRREFRKRRSMAMISRGG